jgi:hypothetical protein
LPNFGIFVVGVDAYLSKSLAFFFSVFIVQVPEVE